MSCVLPASSNAINGSCFYNSTESSLSKNEVITLVAIGTLSLLTAMGALYIYLANPSWMALGHFLNGITWVSWMGAGTLLLAKFLVIRKQAN